MIQRFNIEIDDCYLKDYDDILSSFSNWKRYKREINLNLLLEEGKKIQFDVEISNKSRFLYVSTSDDFQYTTALVNVCCVINKFSFIILNNKVMELKIEVSFLDTKWGNIIKDMIKSDIDLKLYQNKNIEGKVDNFYFRLPKPAA